MNNAQFFDKAFADGPKLVSGFSRPLYHNVAGVLYGHKFDKKLYGGMLRHTEAGMLYRWARSLPGAATIVEIGCYGGLSTSYLAAAVNDRSGSMVYAIDPFGSDLDTQAELTDQRVSLHGKPTLALVKERMRANGFAHCVELIEGYSQQVAAAWQRPIDFLWIDGNHEQAYQDYLDFKPFLSAGSRVGVHDAHPRYGYESVVRDVRRIFADDTEWRDLEHVKSIICGVRS